MSLLQAGGGGRGALSPFAFFHLLGSAQIFNSLYLTSSSQYGNLGGLGICRKQAQKAQGSLVEQL